MTERESSQLRKAATSARGALLVTAVLLGLALVAASLANFREAREAYQTLNRGQVEILENAVRLALQRPGVQVTAAVLDSTVEAHADAGLRYLALLEGDGSVFLEGGETSEPVVVPATFFQQTQASGIVMAPVEGRVRAFLPRAPTFIRIPLRMPADTAVGGPPRPARPNFSDFAPPGSRQDADDAPPPADVDSPARDPLSGRGDGPPRGLPFFGYTVIEFEPVVAMQLMSQARRSLALGSMMAAVLTLAAILFWRQHARYESARSTFEQQRRLSQLGEMSAVLAHEIRNPLASLKGNAQLLAERLPPDSREKSKADRVVTEATRLESLTGDLLEFARSGPIARTAVSPAAIALAAAEEVSPEGILVDTRAAPGEWHLDTARLRHALLNILQNAVQASPDRAPQLTVRRAGGDLIFEVRDFGGGIPAGAESQLFEPFFTTRTNGTGLGLAVARRAAEGHGGSIRAFNHPDGGAVFEIRIPAE